MSGMKEMAPGCCSRSLPPSLQLPHGRALGASEGEASTLQELPQPGASARPPQGSVHSHVLTSAANSTGPIVLPSHHLLHERSQLRLSLVGEICGTNKTSALGLAALLQRGPPALPPHSRSGRRGRGQREKAAASRSARGRDQEASMRESPSSWSRSEKAPGAAVRAGLDPPAALPQALRPAGGSPRLCRSPCPGAPSPPHQLTPLVCPPPLG